MFNVYREFYAGRLEKMVIQDPSDDEGKTVEYQVTAPGMYTKLIYNVFNKKDTLKRSTIAEAEIGDQFTNAMLQGKDPAELPYLKRRANTMAGVEYEYGTDIVFRISDSRR